MQMLNCIHQVGTIKIIYIIYMVLKLKSLCKLQDARYQWVEWKQKPLFTP